ncbi:hypothetical protein PFLUV_G00139270 [Perca fluviatilis]|uniref:Uncharacterized protein n=1 Tax=Perca fluviatilis TaxID=8168 RepID=A0A6A5E5F7_PERFL|nr:hypothetical protein PFLUV_G00139270 [Perca fluviatilis]
MMALLLNSRLLLRKVKDLRCLTPRRNRVKEKWAVTRTKHPPTSLALQHFDATYSVQLGQLWPSVRAALLSERKYGALLNHFSHDAVLADLEAQGCRDFLGDTATKTQPCLEQKPEVATEEESVSMKKCDSDSEQLPPLQLSPNIKCLVFPRGDITRFKPARPDMCGLLGYYLMDAASVLPCLARPRRTQCARPVCRSRRQDPGFTSEPGYRFFVRKRRLGVSDAAAEESPPQLRP